MPTRDLVYNIRINGNADDGINAINQVAQEVRGLGTLINQVGNQAKNAITSNPRGASQGATNKLNADTANSQARLETLQREADELQNLATQIQQVRNQIAGYTVQINNLRGRAASITANALNQAGGYGPLTQQDQADVDEALRQANEIEQVRTRAQSEEQRMNEQALTSVVQLARRRTALIVAERRREAQAVSTIERNQQRQSAQENRDAARAQTQFERQANRVQTAFNQSTNRVNSSENALARLGLGGDIDGALDHAKNILQAAENIRARLQKANVGDVSKIPAQFRDAYRNIKKNEVNGLLDGLQTAIRNAEQLQQELKQLNQEIQTLEQELNQINQIEASGGNLTQEQSNRRNQLALQISGLQTRYNNTTASMNNQVVGAYNQSTSMMTRSVQLLGGSANRAQSIIDGLTGVVKAAGNAVNGMFNAVKHGGRAFIQAFSGLFNSIRYISQGISEFANTLAISVAAPIALLFKSGFNSAVEFEAAMTRVRKTTGMFATELKEVSDGIREMAKISTSSQTELATFAEQFGQMNVTDPNAILRLTRLAEMLASATDISADTVAESLGRIATAFGFDLNTETGVRNVERLANVINKLENETAASAGEIVDGLYSVASVAGMLKIPAEQVADYAAIVSTLISSGIDPGAAGTRLVAFQTQIIQNADKVATLMAGYVRDNQVVYATAEDVLKMMSTNSSQLVNDVFEAMSGVEQDDRAQALGALLDITGRVGARVGVLSGNMRMLNAAMVAAKSEWRDAASLQVEYNAALETTDAHMKVMKNNLNEVAIMVAGTFLPTVNKIIEYAIPIIHRLSAAFIQLNDKTKLLIVAIPLLLVALTPLLMIFGQLVHVISLFGMGIGAILSGTFGAFTSIFAAINSLGGAVGGVLGAFLKVIIGGFSLATGNVAGFGTALLSLGAAILPLLAKGALLLIFISSFKKMSGSLSSFFLGLADKARNWAERLAKTYGNGLLSGAARFISAAATAIGKIIARFFEAHSPPEEGPLSTIDQWGKGLMNTYLKGFYTADFDILRDIAGKIRQVFEYMVSLGSMKEEDLPKNLLAVRQLLAQLISGFNQTGQVADDILQQIGSGFGEFGIELQKLIRYWLDYEKIQRRIKELEAQKKKTLKSYEDEIENIAAMDVSAVERAELIRKATVERDDELNKIEDEKKEQEDLLEVAQEQLEWQKAFVDAMLDELEILKQIADQKDKNSSSGAEETAYSFSVDTEGTDKLNDTVQKFTDFSNIMKERIDRAAEAIRYFWAALNGEAFPGQGYDLDPKAQEYFERYAPKEYAQWKENKGAYAFGEKIRDIWTEVKGVFEDLKPIAEEFFAIITGGNTALSDTVDHGEKLQNEAPVYQNGVPVHPAANTGGSLLNATGGLLEGIMLFAQRIGNIANNQEFWTSMDALMNAVIKSVKGGFIGWLLKTDASKENFNIGTAGIYAAGGAAAEGAKGAFYTATAPEVKLQKIQEAAELVKELEEKRAKEGGSPELNHALAAAQANLQTGKDEMTSASGAKRVLGPVANGLYGAFKNAYLNYIAPWLDNKTGGNKANDHKPIFDYFDNEMMNFLTSKYDPEAYNRVVEKNEKRLNLEDERKNNPTPLNRGTESILSGAGLGVDVSGLFSGEITKWIAQASEDISKWLDTLKENVSLAWDGVKKTTGEKLAEVWGGISDWFTTKWAEMSLWWQGLPDRAREGMAEFTAKVKGKFDEVWTGVQTWFTEKKESIKKGFQEWVDSASEKMGNLGKAIGDAINKGIPDMVTSLRNFVSNAWATLSSLPSRFMNWLNGDDNAFNFSIPAGNGLGQAGGAVGGIPGLAIGGIATRPTLAMVGEGSGPEAIIPLSKLPDLMSTIGSASGFGSGSITVNINGPVVREDGDIKKIAEEVERVLSKKVSSQMRYGRAY